MSDTELRELGAWIASRVMGWRECKLGCIESSGQYAVQGSQILIHDRSNYVKLFHPTTDPATAMMVLEKCAEKSNSQIAITKRGRWFVGVVDWDTEGTELECSSDTLPLTICLFAKKLFAQ